MIQGGSSQLARHDAPPASASAASGPGPDAAAAAPGLFSAPAAAYCPAGALRGRLSGAARRGADAGARAGRQLPAVQANRSAFSIGAAWAATADWLGAAALPRRPAAAARARVYVTGWL